MGEIYIPSFICPHCNTNCSFNGMGIGDSVTLYCNGCKKGVYFYLPNYIIKGGSYRIESSSVADFYPRSILNVDPAIPEDIADDFKEANKCFAVQAKKATVTMCRRVLQNTCISKGADPKKDLFNQIDELESKRIINPSMKDVAHTIRMIGNWGAHPQEDPLKDVTTDDASEIVKFTSEFLDEVFVRPARLLALKAKKKIK